jgi:hypothetical protein
MTNPDARRLDSAKIRSSLRTFIRRHRKSFHSLAQRDTALLEMGALVLASEHYRLEGYAVTTQNTRGNVFKVKLSARGDPFNFSWFECERDDDRFEIHSNLAVSGAYDDQSVYVVDVAVTKADRVPKAKPKKKWVSLANKDLITFAEVKKLVIYPMLLAQFVGIVHEIKPTFLGALPALFRKQGHFKPALVSIGYLKGTSQKILDGFKRRNFRIVVIPGFDAHLGSLRAGEADRSPFTPEKLRPIKLQKPRRTVAELLG